MQSAFFKLHIPFIKLWQQLLCCVELELLFSPEESVVVKLSMSWFNSFEELELLFSPEESVVVRF
jgi:hypothetical protein